MRGRVPDGYRVYQALAPTLRPGAGKTPKLPAAPAIPAADRPKARAGRHRVPRLVRRPLQHRPGRRGRAVGHADLDLRAARVLVRRVGQDERRRARPDRDRVPGRRARVALVRPRSRLSTLGARPADPKPRAARPHGRARAGALLGHGGRPLLGARGQPGQPQPHRGRPRRADAPAARRVRARLRQRLVHDPGRRRRPARVFRPQSLVVTDAFGERTVVPHYTASARRSPSGGCSRSAPPPRRCRAGEDALFLPPVLAASLHGDPIEEVLFIRDELSNLVWAVERLAPSIAGGALNRAELYRDPRPDPVAAAAGRRDRRRGVPPRDDGARLLDPVPAAAHRPEQAGHPPPARGGAARRGRRARRSPSRSAGSSSPSARTSACSRRRCRAAA